MIWVRRENLVPTLLPWAGTLPDQGRSQPGLEHLHACSIRNFSRQPVTKPHHCLNNEFLPNVLSKFTLFYLKPLSPVLSLHYLNLSQFFCRSAFHTIKSPQSWLFYWTRKYFIELKRWFIFWNKLNNLLPHNSKTAFMSISIIFPQVIKVKHSWNKC